MTRPIGSTTLMEDPRPGTGERLVLGLEAIIDAATGILAAQSLEATLHGMAEALSPIVPYTSLAVYSVDWTARACIPVLATGRYVEQTMANPAGLDSSITGSAVLRGELVYLEMGDPDLAAYVMPGTPSGERESMVVAPLQFGGEVKGTLNVWREEQDVVFHRNEIMLLERFASLAAMAYANSTQRDQLRTQALTDELTGLFNRRHFERSLRAALDDGRRRDEPTSIAYFDIDAFKAINDCFGHGVGDEVLRDFASHLSAHTRSSDVVCRTGGEEFIVVLPRTAAEPARALAQRTADAVRRARLGPRGNLTVSAGVATTDDSQEDLERLTHRADGALLRAKRAGRDRVIVADAS